METMEFSQQSEDSSVLIKNIYVQDGGMWVKINLPLSSDGIGELGEYLVELSDGKYLTRQRYVRVWDAERGFHYIHEELSFGLQKAPEIPWTQARLDLENEKIGVGDWGADSIILPLVCDVKNEKNPANYVSPPLHISPHLWLLTPISAFSCRLEVIPLTSSGFKSIADLACYGCNHV